MIGQPRHAIIGHVVLDAPTAITPEPILPKLRGRAYTPPARKRIWKQMPSGRMVDLMAPEETAIDWAGDIAPALAAIARFDGACVVKGRAWTVLDHLVSGHDIVRGLAGDRMAQLWLLHDVHEAYIGDITTPVVSALAATALSEHPDKDGFDAGYYITSAIKCLKAAWDRAIFAAAGAPLPAQSERQPLHTLDQMMMMTERRHMMAQPFHSWGDLERLPSLKSAGKLSPAPSAKLIEGFMARLTERCPATRRTASVDELQQFMGHGSGTVMHTIKYKRGNVVTEYVGLAPAIRALDAEDALEVLRRHQADDEAVDGMWHDALQALVHSYGETLVYNWDDDILSDLVDPGNLAWALSRDRSGDGADAAIHLTRAFSHYPDAVAALDIIARHLNSDAPRASSS